MTRRRAASNGARWPSSGQGLIPLTAFFLLISGTFCLLFLRYSSAPSVSARNTGEF